MTEPCPTCTSTRRPKQGQCIDGRKRYWKNDGPLCSEPCPCSCHPVEPTVESLRTELEAAREENRKAREWLGYLRAPLETARRECRPSADAPQNVVVAWRTGADTVVEILDYLDCKKQAEIVTGSGPVTENCKPAAEPNPKPVSCNPEDGSGEALFDEDGKSRF